MAESDLLTLHEPNLLPAEAGPGVSGEALRFIARSGAALAAVLGLSVLLGWAFNVRALEQVLPGLATMKPNTAACFLAAGVALWLTQTAKLERRPPVVWLLCGAIVTVCGLTLTEYLTGAGLGIDEMLHRDNPQLTPAAYPGRMAIATAACFLMMALSLLASGSRSTARATGWLALPALLVSGLAMMGYAYGVQSLYAIGPYSSMALHTAVGVHLLGLAIVAGAPQTGFIGVLTSDTMGGSVARRLLPATTLLIFLIGWARASGQGAGWYDDRFGLALMVCLCMLLMPVLIVRNGTRLHQTDMERQRAKEKIRQWHTTLEDRVSERNRSLQDAINQVRQLDALLPICPRCQRIRDDGLYWQSVEAYVAARTDTRFTHGMCPECQARMMGEDLHAH
ncbi:MAG: hypothetical protein ABJC74_03700 [Gemmatimonadota bacterium]